MARIATGVAGWDYADWIGPVYPAGVDRLEYVARFVDLIEVNSTFYHPIPASRAESWLDRTSAFPRFTFSAKVHRSWTHETGTPVAAVAPATLEGLAPLHQAGKLAGLVAQFPQSFHDTPASRARIESIAEQTPDWPLVIEVRHGSWGTEEARGWFRDNSLLLCAVDQPSVPDTLPLLAESCSGRGYLRLHGRNRTHWFRPESGRDERYDYLYDAGELEEIAAAIRTLSREAEQVAVVQNNHFRGQALVNALQLISTFSGERPRAPARLLGAYPDLARDVRPEEGRLF